MLSTFSLSNRQNFEDARKILTGLESEFYQGIHSSLTLSAHTIKIFVSIVCTDVENCSQNE